MEWISIHEQLPSEEERVLLYTPYEIFGDDHACIGNCESIKSCKTRCGKQEVPMFTHWMPLPAGPAEHLRMRRVGNVQ